MKRYIFSVTIDEGNDEFWESVEKPEDVTNEVQAILESHGFFDCKVELTMTMENIEHFRTILEKEEKITAYKDGKVVLPNVFNHIFEQFKKRY